jgi:hypothetical protein
LGSAGWFQVTAPLEFQVFFLLVQLVLALWVITQTAQAYNVFVASLIMTEMQLESRGIIPTGNWNNQISS